MARISVYQQNQLRSSLVGTPGVDNSVTSALGSVHTQIEAAATGVNQSLETDYILNQQALRQKQTEQRAAQKHAQGLYNEGIASAGGAETGVALNDLSNELAPKYKDDITGGRQEWDERSKKLIDETLQKYPDPEQRALVQKQINEKWGSQTKQFSDYLTGRMPDIAKANATKVGDALRVATNNASLQGTAVIQQLRNFENDPTNKNVFETAYGAAAPAEMRKHQSAAAQNFMAGVANTGDSKRLDALIHDKQFDKFIDNTDKEQFYSRQRALSSAVETRQKQDMQAEDINTRIGVSNTVLNTDPTDIHSLQQTNQTLRNQLNQQLTRPKGQQSSETVNKIQTELEQNERQIRDLPKQQRQQAHQIAQDQRDAGMRIYNQPDSMKTRAKLDLMAAHVVSVMKLSKNRQEKLNTIHAFEQAVSSSRMTQLDKPGENTRTVKYQTVAQNALDTLNQKKGSRASQIIDSAVHFTQNAFNYFGGIAPPPGKTSLQTRDAAVTAHGQTLQSLIGRYKQKYGKDPDQATLQKMHAYSLQQGGKAALNAR